MIGVSCSSWMFGRNVQNLRNAHKKGCSGWMLNCGAEEGGQSNEAEIAILRDAGVRLLLCMWALSKSCWWAVFASESTREGVSKARSWFVASYSDCESGTMPPMARCMNKLSLRVSTETAVSMDREVSSVWSMS
jgi:hypothetical protein